MERLAVAQAMEKAVTHAAIEEAIASVLSMTEATDEGRMPTTGAKEANSGKETITSTCVPPLDNQNSTGLHKTST